jgi:hypothetical protein
MREWRLGPAGPSDCYRCTDHSTTADITATLGLSNCCTRAGLGVLVGLLVPTKAVSTALLLEATTRAGLGMYECRLDSPKRVVLSDGSAGSELALRERRLGAS